MKHFFSFSYRAKALLSCLLITFVISTISKRLILTTLDDPDHYYHLRLSQMIADSQKIYADKIPQVVGLGWDKGAHEKEFLFHVLTSSFHRIGGETAVVLVQPILFLLITLALFFVMLRLGTGPWTALACILIVFSLNPVLDFRLLLLRPHNLAIPLFLWCFYGILKQSKRQSFIAFALFALAYHAFYLVGIILGISAFVKLLIKRKDFKPEMYALFGLLVGILMNPAFPGQLLMSWYHLKIPLGLAKVPAEADEFRIPSSLAWIRGNFFELILFGFACAVTALHFTKSKAASFKIKFSNVLAKNYEFYICFGVFILFFLLSLKSARAQEYLPVATCLLFATASSFSTFSRKIFGFSLGLVFIATAILNQKQLLAIVRNQIITPPLTQFPRSALVAASALPYQAEEKKVYNCDWDITPFLFYLRPEYTFLDILDPTLFAEADDYLAGLRKHLNALSAPDPYALIKNEFKSKFVLCKKLAFADSLNYDPNFIALYPRSPYDPSSTTAFELRNERVPNEIRTYLISKPVVRTLENLFELPQTQTLYPFSWPWKDFKEFETPSTFVQMNLVYKDQEPTLKENDLMCGYLTIPAEEIKRMKGRDHLVINGLQQVAIWIDNKQIYQTNKNRGSQYGTPFILKLAAPIRDDSTVTAQVCATKATPNQPFNLGLNLAFYTTAEIKTICEEKVPADMRKYSDVPKSVSQIGDMCLGFMVPPG